MFMNAAGMILGLPASFAAALAFHADCPKLRTALHMTSRSTGLTLLSLIATRKMASACSREQPLIPIQKIVNDGGELIAPCGRQH